MYACIFKETYPKAIAKLEEAKFMSDIQMEGEDKGGRKKRKWFVS